MATANSPENNLSPWKPGQSGNPTGRPRGTRDLAGYVLGLELVDAWDIDLVHLLEAFPPVVQHPPFRNGLTDRTIGLFGIGIIQGREPSSLF